MRWTIQYRKKGENIIKTEVVETHFERKNDVKGWWLGLKSKFVNCIDNKTIGGNRQDFEFINAFQDE